MEGIERWRARGREVEIFGRRVFVVEEGDPDAQVLVLLHGYPSSSADFEAALPALAARYRVIVHDHLGFGMSEKPSEYSYSLLEQAETAVGLWRELGVTEAHVLAHDYGTSVATELVARAARDMLPLSLRTLTLCNGSVHIELARPRLAQQILRAPLIGSSFARLATKPYFERNVQAIVHQEIDKAELDRMWALLVRDGGRERLPAISQYLGERNRFWHRWVGALQATDLPTHVLWGREDPVAVPDIARALADEIDGATLTWLPDLGHYPMIEDPDRWAEAALGWLGDR